MPEGNIGALSIAYVEDQAATRWVAANNPPTLSPLTSVTFE
jgi:hypothetical protein